jgi:hypothetical protein
MAEFGAGNDFNWGGLAARNLKCVPIEKFSSAHGTWVGWFHRLRLVATAGAALVERPAHA